MRRVTIGQLPKTPPPDWDEEAYPYEMWRMDQHWEARKSLQEEREDEEHDEIF